MGQLISLTGLAKSGEEYPILINEEEVRSINGNKDPQGSWRTVVDLKAGRSHFVKETFEMIKAQLNRGSR